MWRKVSKESAFITKQLPPLLAEELDLAADTASITPPRSEAIGSTNICLQPAACDKRV